MNDLKARLEMKVAIRFLKLFAILLTVPAWAGGGDGTGNGGSPVHMRAKLIKEYINTDLRNDVHEYMSNLRLMLVTDSAAQRALKQMLEQDVLADIRQSSYVLQSTCTAIGGQDAAGAINGDLGGDICLSPMSLAELDATKAELVGLMIHEHAHHFGFADLDYAIYKAVYTTVSLANPSWGGTKKKKQSAYSRIDEGVYWNLMRPRLLLRKFVGSKGAEAIELTFLGDNDEPGEQEIYSNCDFEYCWSENELQSISVRLHFFRGESSLYLIVTNWIVGKDGVKRPIRVLDWLPRRAAI